MTQRAFCSTILIAFWGLYPFGALFAQQPSALQVYDASINRFLEAGKQDSFKLFVQKKCLLAQQMDSLECWAWAQFDAYESFEMPPEQALKSLDDILQKRWRAPRNPQEWLPFLYIQASRGWHLYELGQIWPSIQAYQTAADLFEQYHYPDFDALETLYKPLGSHFIRLGDDDKAIAVFEKAQALDGTAESLAGLYCDIGLAYWNKGEFGIAEANYRRGLDFAGISNLKLGLLTGALAQTKLDNGQIAQSAQIAAQSLRLLQSEKPIGNALKYRCYSRRTAGVANLYLGRFAEADRLLSGAYSDALAVFGPHSRELGKIEVARSTLLLRQGNAAAALSAADRALNAVMPGFKPDRSGKQNPDPALFYEENTIFEALTAKSEAARALFDQRKTFDWLELALEGHDLAWQAESVLRRVFQYSSSKLNLQKAARKREEAAMDLARLLFEQTGERRWLEKAFVIAERSKAALLLEALQDNLVRQRLAGNDSRFESLNTLRQRLAFLDKKRLLASENDQIQGWRLEADELQTQIVALEQSLRKSYPNLANLDLNSAHWLPQSGDFSEGEMLLEYFMSEYWVDVWVCQNGQVSAWKRLPNDAALQDQIRQYLAFFATDYAILNDPDGYFKTAHALWQKLLPEESAGATQLVILPDGLLNFISFEALLTAYDGRTNMRNAAYLLRQQEIRYGWSLAVLRQQQGLHSRAPKDLLSIAPGFAQQERGLAPLAIPDFDWAGLAGWDNAYLHGQKADYQHFLKLAGDYRVLHFSTHAFAGGDPRIELMDQALLLPDLYALPLQADLVMLSACESGLGKDEKGEGVMSLARAFAQAGAAGIVSSLWSVNDQRTSQLLGYFYKEIGQGRGTSAALRAAKLAYLSDDLGGMAAKSPYFWAGLVLVGDDRSIASSGGGFPWIWVVVGLVLVLLIWVNLRFFRGWLVRFSR